MEGLYDDFYYDFIETRAKQIFELIDLNIKQKEKKILANFYQAPISSSSGNIKVFATYYNRKIEATFDRETEKILYNGEKYSVSAAANKAKEDLSGKENVSTNGWKFWRYLTDSGEERPIDDFRKSIVIST